MRNWKFQIESSTIFQLSLPESAPIHRFYLFCKILYQSLTVFGTGLTSLLFLYYAAAYLPVHLYSAEVD